MHTNKWSKTKWNKTKQNKNKAKQSKTKNQIFFLNLPRPHHSIYLLYHKCHLAQEREKGHRGSWWHWERKSFNWVLCKSTCLYVGYSYIHPEYFYGNFSACFCEIPHPSDSVAISHCFFFSTTFGSCLEGGDPAHPCPNKHCQVFLQQTLFQRNNQESAQPGISENGSSHLEICRAVCVSVYVCRGNPLHYQDCLPLRLRRQIFVVSF